MTRTNVGISLFLVLLALCLASPAHCQIMVTSDEVWDGVSNPHAGDGVTLAGGVYTIPDELVIGSGATLFLNAGKFEDGGVTPTPSITFDFVAGAGGLTFADATSAIDVHDGDRFGSTTTFTLNMQDNNIQGDGRIVNGPVAIAQTGSPMFVEINSLADVSLGAIDISKKDARLGSINITAHGAVDIDTLSTSDVVDGGASAGSILIRGQSITLDDIDTRAFRLDGNADNGSVTLRALAPPSFDPGNAAGNRAANNVLTLNGALTTNGPATVPPNVGGNVDLAGVKVVLGSGFSLDLAENGTLSMNAGVAGFGFTEADLFMDMAGTGLSANHNVEHIPEPSTFALLFCGALVAWGRRRRR